MTHVYENVEAWWEKLSTIDPFNKLELDNCLRRRTFQESDSKPIRPLHAIRWIGARGLWQYCLILPMLHWVKASTHGPQAGSMEFHYKQVELGLKKRWNAIHNQTPCCKSMIHPDNWDDAYYISGTRRYPGLHQDRAYYTFVEKESTTPRSRWEDDPALNPAQSLDADTKFQKEPALTFVKMKMKTPNQKEVKSIIRSYKDLEVKNNHSDKNSDNNDDIGIATARIARRSGFDDDERQRALREVIGGLSEVARRTGGILPVEDIFTGIGRFDPARLVILRRELHQMVSGRSEDSQIAACIRQIQRAMGYDGIVTDGPGAYIAILSDRTEVTCMLGGYTSTSTSKRNQFDLSMPAGLSGKAWQALEIQGSVVHNWKQKYGASFLDRQDEEGCFHGVTRFLLIPSGTPSGASSANTITSYFNSVKADTTHRIKTHSETSRKQATHK